MENQVFRLSEGLKLIPISFTGAEIGNRVRYARDYGVYTIIGKENSGWIICNGKGETHSGQQIESLSPFTRIEVLTALPNATQAEIEALLEAVEEKRIEDKLQMQIETDQKNTEYEKCLAELKKQYPNAEQKGRDYARAAKNLKAELKQAFPLVKFSVKSDSFSMGDSIRVFWENGCTTAQVKAIAQKYEYGKFDSSEDLYNYNSTGFSKASEEWLGSTKYLNYEREISTEIKEQVRTSFLNEFNREMPDHEIHNKVYRALVNAEIYGEYVGLEIEAGECVAKFAHVPFDHPAPQSAQTSIEGFSTAEFIHTEKGETCFVATLLTRLDTADFKAMMSQARSFGGYYSRFNKNGAIAGFIFKSKDQRKNFIETINTL